MQYLIVIILGLLASNAAVSYMYVKEIESHAKYVAKVEFSTKQIKAQNAKDLAEYKIKLAANQHKIEELNKSYDEEIQKVKFSSDSALNDAIARMRKRADNCQNRMPSTIAATKGDSAASASRGVDKSISELSELYRVVNKWEAINKSYAKTLAVFTNQPSEVKEK